MAGLSSEAPEVRRIIKKVKGHGGHHGGAWKVAYADFVTAMMALFIVLWIVGQSQSLRQNVAQYFKNPGVLTGSTGMMDKSDLGGAIPTPGHSQELQKPPPAPEEIAADQARLEEVKKNITDIIAQLPELKKMEDQIRLEMTAEGLRIELMEKDNSNFFDVGSANLNPAAREIFTVIAREVSKLPNQVTLEGHTDARPYGGQNYTNWELSADRANAARRLMETGGLRPEQVANVRGYADRNLFDAKDPNDCRNRRVGIVVNYLDSKNPVPFDLPPGLNVKKGNGAPVEKTGPGKGASLPLPATPALPAPTKAKADNGIKNGQLSLPSSHPAPPGPAATATIEAKILQQPSSTPEAAAKAQPAPDKVGLPIVDISPKLDANPTTEPIKTIK